MSSLAIGFLTKCASLKINPLEAIKNLSPTERSEVYSSLSALKLEKRAANPFGWIAPTYRAVTSTPVGRHLAQSGVGALLGGSSAYEATGDWRAGLAGGAAGAVVANPMARRQTARALGAGLTGGNAINAGRMVPGAAGLRTAPSALARTSGTAANTLYQTGAGASIGGGAGFAADQTARAMGYDDTNFAQYGALAGGAVGGARGLAQSGMLMGRGPNAVSWLRNGPARTGSILNTSTAATGGPLGAPLASQVRNPGLGSRINPNGSTWLGRQAANVDQALARPLRAAHEFSNQFVGPQFQAMGGALRFAAGSPMRSRALQWLNAPTRAGTLGRRLGMGLLGAGAVGTAYNALGQRVNQGVANTANAVLNEGEDRAHDFMHEHGMLDPRSGQFNPNVTARLESSNRFVNPLIQMLGLGQQQGQHGQLGVAHPWMGGGPQGQVPPHLAGLHGLPYMTSGQYAQQGAGSHPNSPQARNELAVQTQRPAPAVSGQGYL